MTNLITEIQQFWISLDQRDTWTPGQAIIQVGIRVGIRELPSQPRVEGRADDLRWMDAPSYIKALGRSVQKMIFRWRVKCSMTRVRSHMIQRVLMVRRTEQRGT